MRFALSIVALSLLHACSILPSPLITSAETVRVRYGYFREARPFGSACGRGWFDLDLGEGNTSYKVSCYPQTSGLNAVSRLDSGQLDVSLLGSTPLAQAAARGVDIQVVYIEHYKGSSQGIYVRASEEGYDGIKTPRDLKGRKVGVPFGTTIHYQLLFVLDEFDLQGDVTLIDMPASGIINAWRDKLIDAAACWGEARDYLLQGDPALGLLPAGELLTARTISGWGRPTFNVAAASRRFAADHPEFMKYFVGILSRLNDSYLNRLEEVASNNSRRWNAGLPAPSSLVPSVADALMSVDERPGDPSAAYINQQSSRLALFDQQPVTEQLSCDYLGRCSKPTLQHIAIQDTAIFLFEQKITSSLGQLSSMGDADGCSDPNTLCGGTLLDATWLDRSHETCASPGCHRLGRYWNESASTNEVLDKLEQFDQLFGRHPFPANEIGRQGGDSTCSRLEPLVLSSSSALSEAITFGDGANGLIGKVYSEELNCNWQLRAPDCQSSASPCEKVVEVSFSVLRSWTGDFVRVYTDPDFHCLEDSPRLVLLGQLSGFYDPDGIPPFRATGCILVQFETDFHEERSYGDEDNSGAGFLAVAWSDDGCSDSSDCSGFPCSSQTGLCQCGRGHWGGDCSRVNRCLGTQYMDLGQGDGIIVLNETMVALTKGSPHEVDVVDPELAYANDLDCTYVVEASQGTKHLQVKIVFDLEESFDLLRLQTGASSSEQGTVPYVELTGNSKGAFETYFVPVDASGLASLRLTTDSRGRRHGFYAEVSANNMQESFCENGFSGANCEIPYCRAEDTPVLDSYFTDEESFYSNVDSLSFAHMLGRVVSQPDGRPVRPMPWAPEGGCAWRFLGLSPPSGVVGIRIGFNSPLDLEPYPSSKVGDKLVIESSSQRTELFVEQCDSDEVCSFHWQTGVCNENGSCDIRGSMDIEMPSVEGLSALLVTDRNDGDEDYYGLDFEVFLVEQCPSEQGMKHCEAHKGSKCVKGYCICEGGPDEKFPCSCPCQGDAPEVITSRNTEAFIGVTVGLVLFFIMVFLVYRTYKNRKERAQQEIIDIQDAELETFRNSVIGVRTATTHYIPTVSMSHGSRPAVTPSVVWCWEETSHKMSRYKEDEILGEGNWVKYLPDGNSKLEANYQEDNQGTCVPLQGYVVDFSTMTQTNNSTDYVRKVKRIVTYEVNDQLMADDLKDAQFGDPLPEELHGEPQMVLVKGDVIQISKEWEEGWAFGTKLRHVDEPAARKWVRTITLGLSEDVLTDSGWFQLNATDTPTAEDLHALRVRVGNFDAFLEAPNHWTETSNPATVQQWRLGKGNPEREAVVEAFLKTLKSRENRTRVEVVRVNRIQNLAIWQSYVVKRQTICRRENSNLSDAHRFERRWLWHGTSIDVAEKIIQQGFNRSFCGRTNAAVYGRGVYFARDASYSTQKIYAVADRKGFQYVLACRVVVGEYCLGKRDVLTPDVRDHQTQLLYDSTVGVRIDDDLSDPSIFVTYHDAQAYPEYLIKFKIFDQTRA